MSAVARMNPTWATKWSIMAVVMLGWGVLCIYDARVAYPAHDQRAAKAQEFKKEIGEGEQKQWVWKDDDAARKWAEFARTQGWSDADPGPAHQPKDYTAQWGQLAICWPLALIALGMVARVSRQRLEADADGVTGTNGKKIPYAAIQSIDKARWDSKGIAMLHWEMDGKTGKLKIDDWVFRDGDKVLEVVERHTGLGATVVG